VLGVSDMKVASTGCVSPGTKCRPEHRDVVRVLVPSGNAP
jgi:hypothetical protein